MAGDPVNQETLALEFRYRVQDIIVMQLYTLPRTPFFLSFLGLIYVLFLVFFARQEDLGLPVLYALLPTTGCALIGLMGATLQVVFSKKAKTPRQVQLDDSGITLSLDEETTLIEWGQIKYSTQFANYLFMKLRNGSYLMIPGHAQYEALRRRLTAKIAETIAKTGTETKNPA